MKRHLVGIFAAMILAGGVSGAPQVATTIDFLDYVFANVGNIDRNLYPVELYEQRIAELADAGISKIYLRVNACGLTLYDSRVSARYGKNGAFHWNNADGALRLINTLEKYDPLTETIRLGHKYGMEVWAWDSLWDDAGLEAGTTDPRFIKFAEANGNWPLLDPFLRENPDCQAMISPFRDIAPDELAAVNAAARRLPVGTIELINSRRGPNTTLEPGRFRIFVSDDNRNYRPWTEKFTVTSRVDEQGFQRYRIEGLNIDSDYVKISHGDNFVSGSPSPFLLSRMDGQYQVFNTAGEPIETTWTLVVAPERDGGVLSFRRFSPGGWDHQTREIGFFRGRIAPQRHFYGMPEYTVPAAMEHKLERFREVAAYPFDGFMFNVRCHSPAADPTHYGFNPEVLEKFRARFGREIADTAADTAAVMQIRAESLAEFFRRCRQESGGRPIYLSGLPNDPAIKVQQMADFTFLPWLYERYFSDGSIDGVMMLTMTGTDFRNSFTPEIVGGRAIRFGVFREAIDWQRRRQALIDDLRALSRRDDIDEIELYEAEILNYTPDFLRLISEITDKEAGK